MTHKENQITLDLSGVQMPGIDQESMLKGFPGNTLDGSNEMVYPPDIVSYTSYRPDSKKKSYASFGALQAPIGGSQSFSYSLRVRFDNLGAFTCGWVDNQCILSIRDGQTPVGGISISYNFGKISLLCNYRNGTFFGMPVTLGQWYHLGFTWDGVKETATFYLYGAPWGSLKLDNIAIKSPVFSIGLNSTDPPAKPSMGITGSPFVGSVDSFSVWNTCLDPIDMCQLVWTSAKEPVRKEQLVLGCNFTTTPISNICPTGPVVNSVNGLYLWESPALSSLGIDVATPGQATKANPGGSGPFSILAWIFVGDDVHSRPVLNGSIISNGQLDTSQYLNFFLSNGNLVADIGGTTVTSKSQIAGYSWYYVGVTYDGQTCSLYINGSLDNFGQISGKISPPESAINLFGATAKDVLPKDKFFRGYIQFLSVWKTCLDATTISLQQYKNPTGSELCIGNFTCSAVPCKDSKVMSGSSLWSLDEINSGVGIGLRTIIGTSYSTVTLPEIKEDVKSPELRRISINPVRRFIPAGTTAVKPFSKAHKQLMIAEFKSSLSAIRDNTLAEKMLVDFTNEVNTEFDAAANSLVMPKEKYVTYELVNGEYVIYYHPDASTKIDLGIRVDITAECAAWWVTYILTAVLGICKICGIPTYVDDLSELAGRVVNDPVVIETLSSCTGGTFTALTFLSFLRVLYDFGYLSQFIWMVFSKLSWRKAPAFIIYIIGVVSPATTPQKAILIANSVIVVGQLTAQLLNYPTACGKKIMG